MRVSSWETEKYTETEKVMWRWREIGIMCLQAKEGQGLLAATRSRGEVWDSFTFRAYKEESNLPTPWLRTSDIQNCEKINFAVIMHPPVVICYDSHRNLIQYPATHQTQTADISEVKHKKQHYKCIRRKFRKIFL